LNKRDRWLMPFVNTLKAKARSKRRSTWAGESAKSGHWRSSPKADRHDAILSNLI
jgi:hypothetical protein